MEKAKEEKEEYKLVQVLGGGRITIPKDRRQELDLKEGDYVLLSLKRAKITIEEGGSW